MRRYLATALLLISPAILHANSCWDSASKAASAFDELDNQRFLTLRNGVTCQPVANATVEIDGQRYRSNANGRVDLETLQATDGSQLRANISAEGFIRREFVIPYFAGTLWQSRILLSPELPPTAARFILSWGDSPRDLDLHLRSDRIHISYRNMRDFRRQLTLDVDAMRGYGPETITVNNLHRPGNFELLVHQYSSDGTLDAQARVAVYGDNRLLAEVPLNPGAGRCQKVADIRQGRLEPLPQAIASSACR
jgi:hypothetical protein